MAEFVLNVAEVL